MQCEYVKWANVFEKGRTSKLEPTEWIRKNYPSKLVLAENTATADPESSNTETKRRKTPQSVAVSKSSSQKVNRVVTSLGSIVDFYLNNVNWLRHL